MENKLLYEEYVLNVLKRYYPEYSNLNHVDKPDLQSDDNNVEVMVLVTEDLAHLTGVIYNYEQKPKAHYKNKNISEKVGKIPDTYIIGGSDENIRYVVNDDKIREYLCQKYEHKLLELNDYLVNDCDLFICMEECPSDLNTINFNFTEENYLLYLDLLNDCNSRFIDEWMRSHDYEPRLYERIMIRIGLRIVQLSLVDKKISFIDIDESFNKSLCEDLYSKYDQLRLKRDLKS